MNWQIFALILGILALLVSLLELLGEINKKRMLDTLKKGKDLFVPLPDPPSHPSENANDPAPHYYFVEKAGGRYKDDIIHFFESCSIEQRMTLLQYLHNKQLAEMERTHLSGVWWFFLGLFQQAYSSAEHRNSHSTKKNR